MRAVVITHAEMGVYLGNALGLGFWTLLDCVGQDAACVFLDERDARQHVAGWDENNDPDRYGYVEVFATHDGAACREDLINAKLGDLVGRLNGPQCACGVFADKCDRPMCDATDAAANYPEGFQNGDDHADV